jgi:ornithine carbamoyltransferase
MPMCKRDFLTITDLSSAELEDLLELGLTIKREHQGGRLRKPLTDKVLGLVFHKPSLRTRVSFESGMSRLGGSAMYLSNQEIGMGTREAVSDIAEVLSRYVDGIMIRTFSHAWVEEMAAHSGVPVINGLTDSYHPCQILADLLTMAENFSSLEGRKVVFVGDGNNVARSWINAARRLPIRVTVSGPEGYEPDAGFMDEAGKETDDRVQIEHDLAKAVEGADVIYTDVWASMGQEDEAAARKAMFAPYQVNSALLNRAGKGVIVLHCLPAHRDEEITHDVIADPRSRIFDQAENRMHAQNALLIRLLAEGWS